MSGKKKPLDPTVDLDLVNQCIAAHIERFLKEHDRLKQFLLDNDRLKQELIREQKTLDKIDKLQSDFKNKPSMNTFLALKNSRFFPELHAIEFPPQHRDYLQKCADYEAQYVRLENRLLQLQEGYEKVDVESLYDDVTQEIEDYLKSQSQYYIHHVILGGDKFLRDACYVPVEYLTLALMERMKRVAFFKARLRYTLERYMIEKLPVRDKGKKSWLSLLDELIYFVNSPNGVIVPGSEGCPLYQELAAWIETFTKKDNKVKSKLLRLFNFVVMDVPNMDALELLEEGMHDILCCDLSHQIKGAAKTYFKLNLAWIDSRFNIIWNNSYSVVNQEDIFEKIEQDATYRTIKLITAFTHDDKQKLRREIERRFVGSEALILNECLELGYSIQALDVRQQKQWYKIRELLQNRQDESQSASKKMQHMLAFWHDYGGGSKKPDDLAWLIHSITVRYQLENLKERACDELEDVKSKQCALEPMKIKWETFVSDINQKVAERKHCYFGQMDSMSHHLRCREQQYRQRRERLQNKDREMLEKLKRQVALVLSQYQKKEGVDYIEQSYYGKKGLAHAKDFNHLIQECHSYVAACDLLQHYFSKVKELHGYVKLRDHSFASRLLIILFDNHGVFNKDAYASDGVSHEVLLQAGEETENRVAQGLRLATTRHHLFFQHPTNAIRLATAAQAVKVAETLRNYFAESEAAHYINDTSL